jgi:hypothetical protein
MVGLFDVWNAVTLVTNGLDMSPHISPIKSNTAPLIGVGATLSGQASPITVSLSEIVQSVSDAEKTRFKTGVIFMDKSSVLSLRRVQGTTPTLQISGATTEYPLTEVIYAPLQNSDSYDRVLAFVTSGEMRVVKLTASGFDAVNRQLGNPGFELGVMRSRFIAGPFAANVDAYPCRQAPKNTVTVAPPKSVIAVTQSRIYTEDTKGDSCNAYYAPVTTSTNIASPSANTWPTKPTPTQLDTQTGGTDSGVRVAELGPQGANLEAASRPDLLRMKWTTRFLDNITGTYYIWGHTTGWYTLLGIKRTSSTGWWFDFYPLREVIFSYDGFDKDKKTTLVFSQENANASDAIYVAKFAAKGEQTLFAALGSAFIGRVMCSYVGGRTSECPGPPVNGVASPPASSALSEREARTYKDTNGVCSLYMSPLVLPVAPSQPTTGPPPAPPAVVAAPAQPVVVVPMQLVPVVVPPTPPAAVVQDHSYAQLGPHGSKLESASENDRLRLEQRAPPLFLDKSKSHWLVRKASGVVVSLIRNTESSTNLYPLTEVINVYESSEWKHILVFGSESTRFFAKLGTGDLNVASKLLGVILENHTGVMYSYVGFEKTTMCPSPITIAIAPEGSALVPTLPRVTMDLRVSSASACTFFRGAAAQTPPAAAGVVAAVVVAPPAQPVLQPPVGPPAAAGVGAAGVGSCHQLETCLTVASRANYSEVTLRACGTKLSGADCTSRDHSDVELLYDNVFVKLQKLMSPLGALYGSDYRGSYTVAPDQNDISTGKVLVSAANGEYATFKCWLSFNVWTTVQPAGLQQQPTVVEPVVAGGGAAGVATGVPSPSSSDTGSSLACNNLAELQTCLTSRDASDASLLACGAPLRASATGQCPDFNPSVFALLYDGDLVQLRAFASGALYGSDAKNAYTVVPDSATPSTGKVLVSSLPPSGPADATYKCALAGNLWAVVPAATTPSAIVPAATPPTALPAEPTKPKDPDLTILWIILGGFGVLLALVALYAASRSR